MTRKERFERALRCEEVDRIPYWVKIFNASWRERQGGPCGAMSELELADHLDLEHMAGGPSPAACRNDRVTRHVEQQDGVRTERIETPDGVLTAAERFDPGSHSWHPVEFAIKSRDDLQAARHVFAGNRFEVDAERLDRARARVAEVGDRGIAMTGMGISPWMDLVQHLAGPERAYFLRLDHPAEVDELVGLMHEERLRYLRCLLPVCPYDYVMSVENTSTTLLSPAIFENVCWPHLNAYGDLIAEHGVSHILHMCGKLRALLPRIDALPALAVEAYTSPPVGDTTLADRAALCPSTAVIGGTNAALWIRPADEICAAIEQSVAEAGSTRGLVLTSAGVMPPTVTVETIRRVGDFVHNLRVAELAG